MHSKGIVMNSWDMTSKGIGVNSIALTCKGMEMKGHALPRHCVDETSEGKAEKGQA